MIKYKLPLQHFLISIMLFIVLLFTAVQVVAFNPFYFRWYYSANQIDQVIGTSSEDLMGATQKMMRYLESKEMNMDYEIEVDGQKEEFFDSKDKAHMVDVKYLFEIGFFIRNIALMALILVFATKYLRNPKAIQLYGQRFFKNMAGILIFFGIIVGLVSLDFENAFIVFHKILFRNDLWLLDPDVSRLINIVPESFFVLTAILICVTFVIFVLGSYLGLKLLERTSIYNEEKE